jgi:hypothetical protein
VLERIERATRVQHSWPKLVRIVIVVPLVRHGPEIGRNNENGGDLRLELSKSIFPVNWKNHVVPYSGDSYCDNFSFLLVVIIVRSLSVDIIVGGSSDMVGGSSLLSECS